MSSSWSLSKQSFDLLLHWLNEDRAEAATRYEIERLKLIRIFENRGAEDAESLADEVFNRACRKLEEGTVDLSTEPARLLYGIARNLLKEDYRKQSASRRITAVMQPVEAVAARESHLLAMELCIACLPPADRDLFARYMESAGAERIEARALLAKEFGLNPVALRVRIARIRKAIADCILRRMKEMERNESRGGVKWD